MAHDEVDVFVAIDVPLEATLAVGDVEGKGGGVAVVVGDTGGELAQCFLVFLGGTLMLVHVVLQDGHGLFPFPLDVGVPLDIGVPLDVGARWSVRAY